MFSSNESRASQVAHLDVDEFALPSGAHGDLPAAIRAVAKRHPRAASIASHNTLKPAPLFLVDTRRGRKRRHRERRPRLLAYARTRVRTTPIVSHTHTHTPQSLPHLFYGECPDSDDARAAEPHTLAARRCPPPRLSRNVRKTKYICIPRERVPLVTKQARASRSPRARSRSRAGRVSSSSTTTTRGCPRKASRAPPRLVVLDVETLRGVVARRKRGEFLLAAGVVLFLFFKR